MIFLLVFRGHFYVMYCGKKAEAWIRRAAGAAAFHRYSADERDGLCFKPLVNTKKILGVYWPGLSSSAAIFPGA